MSENSDEDICGSTETSTGDPCQRGAGWGTRYESGHCTTHRNNGGAPKGNQHAKGNPGGSAPENNDNAETHALHADTVKWFERNREDIEDDVRALVEDWVDDAPFGWDARGNVNMLVECAINEMQMRQANDYIHESGVIIDKVVGQTEYGDPITSKEENPALLPKARLQKDTMRILKDLGVLDDPESQKAESIRDAGAVWEERITPDEG